MKKFILLCLLLFVFCGCEKDAETIDDGGHRASTSFRSPLQEYFVSQKFAKINIRFSRNYHTGEDASGIAGTPVYAAADGYISYSGPGGGYGWLITIEHPTAKVYSLYGHLSIRRDKITEGKVKKGQIIGFLADKDEDGSGDGYPDWGCHLHFAIRKGSRYDYPDDGDDRWMAGYTSAHPTELGWLDPTDFVKGHSQ